jgi:hypothetical protein
VFPRLVLPHILGVTGGWSFDTFLNTGTFVIDIRGDCSEDAGNIVASSVANAALILCLDMCAGFLEAIVILVGITFGTTTVVISPVARTHTMNVMEKRMLSRFENRGKIGRRLL